MRKQKWWSGCLAVKGMISVKNRASCESRSRRPACVGLPRAAHMGSHLSVGDGTGHALPPIPYQAYVRKSTGTGWSPRPYFPMFLLPHWWELFAWHLSPSNPSAPKVGVEVYLCGFLSSLGCWLKDCSVRLGYG